MSAPPARRAPIMARADRMSDAAVPYVVACVMVALGLLAMVSMVTAFLLFGVLIEWWSRRRGEPPDE